MVNDTIDVLEEATKKIVDSASENVEGVSNSSDLTLSSESSSKSESEEEGEDNDLENVEEIANLDGIDEQWESEGMKCVYVLLVGYLSINI